MAEKCEGWEALALELLELVEKLVPEDKYKDYELIGYAQYVAAHPGYFKDSGKSSSSLS